MARLVAIRYRNAGIEYVEHRRDPIDDLDFDDYEGRGRIRILRNIRRGRIALGRPRLHRRDIPVICAWVAVRLAMAE